MGSDGRSPFVVGAARTDIAGGDDDVSADFARCRAFHAPGAVDGDFLARLLGLCNRGTFVPDVVEGLGLRQIETPGITGGALTLALKRPNLLLWIEQVTGCGPLESVEGRVVQTFPAPDHQLTWHDDRNDPRRRLAITINLSEETYDGGLFELRSTVTGEILLHHRHVAQGAALIFEVAKGLEHRVLPLTSGGPRRVYTGWFLRREP